MTTLNLVQISTLIRCAVGRYRPTDNSTIIQYLTNQGLVTWCAGSGASPVVTTKGYAYLHHIQTIPVPFVETIYVFEYSDMTSIIRMDPASPKSNPLFMASHNHPTIVPPSSHSSQCIPQSSHSHHTGVKWGPTSHDHPTSVP